MSAVVSGGSRIRRHLAIALVLVGLVAAAPGVATLAGFTARDVNRDNVISTGSLDIAFGTDSRYVSVANMKPGDWMDQTVAVANTGSLAEDYTLSAQNLRVRAGADLDEVLRVTVRGGDGVLAEGVRLSELRGLPGRLEPGATDLFEVRIAWPENAPEVDNRFQGAALDFDLVVDATQLTTTTTEGGAAVEIPTGGLSINGVEGQTALEAPFDPKVAELMVPSEASARFTVVNTSERPIVFRFEASGPTGVWKGDGKSLVTVIDPRKGWDGHRVEIGPQEKLEFLANGLTAATKLSVVAIG